MQAPSMVLGKYPTAFPLKHQQKDMRLALEAAGEGGMKLPVAAAANDLYVKVTKPHLQGVCASCVIDDALGIRRTPDCDEVGPCAMSSNKQPCDWLGGLRCSFFGM